MSATETVVVITGSGGLVGVEAAKYFSQKFDKVIGLDNDSRGYFFGPGGSVFQNVSQLKKTVSNYHHISLDIRDKARLQSVFEQYGKKIKLVINAAAQPSHDWSGKNPLEDFEINAFGAVVLLETVKNHCSEAVFIQLSSSKVYGSSLNSFEYIEGDSRFDLPQGHKYYQGFDSTLALDRSLHSPYGASKLGADVMCQEYGFYYGIPVGVFRPNCITGGNHSGVELHGFLSYLIKCEGTYNVFGYKGKQVRDNIHAYDLIRAFDMFFESPIDNGVFNIGGGRANSCSILEAIELVNSILSKPIDYVTKDNARVGDHVWWITNNDDFIKEYPDWSVEVSLEQIIEEIDQHARGN